jgi:hypothetical protein
MKQVNSMPTCLTRSLIFCMTFSMAGSFRFMARRVSCSCSISGGNSGPATLSFNVSAFFFNVSDTGSDFAGSDFEVRCLGRLTLDTCRGTNLAVSFDRW